MKTTEKQLNININMEDFKKLKEIAYLENRKVAPQIRQLITDFIKNYETENGVIVIDEK